MTPDAMAGIGAPTETPDLRPSVLEVDLGAIAHNVRALKARCGEVTFVAALKANAYGFGLLPVARTVLATGADVIALARLEHAVALREAGIAAPILLYAGLRPDPQVAEAVARHAVTVTVVDGSDLSAYASAAAAGRPVRCMVKIDVGLARLGVEPPGAVALVRSVHDHPGLELAGVYTHLHVPPGTPDEVGRYVEWQFERFARVLDDLAAAAVDVPLRIAVSSGAIRLLDGMTLNGIDVGTLLFGLDPPNSSDLPGRDLGLRPALVRLVTRLSQVRDVRRDDFPAQSPIPTGRVVRLGVIPMGASDGLLGISTGEVLVGGRRGRVLAISLEHTRLDLTGIDARAGDEVVIIGRQGDDAITPRDIATAKGLYGTAQVPVLITQSVARRYIGAESAG
jgi:alanine racemase